VTAASDVTNDVDDDSSSKRSDISIWDYGVTITVRLFIVSPSIAMLHPSVCLSVCPTPLAQQRCALGHWLLQNTNKKPSAGSRSRWSAWREVAETKSKSSPAPLQKHSLGASPSTGSRRSAVAGGGISFRPAIACYVIVCLTFVCDKKAQELKHGR